MKKLTIFLFLILCTISINSQVTKLFESFETSVPPAGWRSINVTGTNVWNRVTAPLTASFGTLPAKHGTAVAFIDYQAPTGEDWLVSPRINGIVAGDSVVFWLVKQFSDGPYPYDSLLVRVSTTDSLQASFTQYAGKVCVHCIPVGATEIIWRRYSFPLTTWAGQNIFLSFVHKDSDGHGMVLDSIAVFGNAATGIVQDPNAVPTRFELHQNYPNPFNPVTTINYDLPENGIVTIKIYDILGRQMKTLVNEMKTAGYHKIIFNAADLSSGAYFYRMTAGDYVAVKKFVVMK